MSTNIPQDREQAVSNKPIRLLCVEDNPLVGDAIGRKLMGEPGFEWIGCVSSAEALFQKLQPVPPDVVSMDLEMPGQDAFEMIRELQERSPAVRVLVLTGHMGQEYVERAIDAGAWGYLSKAEESRFIIEAFRRVAAGEFVAGALTPSAAQREKWRQASATSAPAPSLWASVKKALFGS